MKTVEFASCFMACLAIILYLLYLVNTYHDQIKLDQELNKTWDIEICEEVL